MLGPEEVTAEDDSLDSHTSVTDEEAIAPRHFQTSRRKEYEALTLSPGKSMLKVLWDRVSAEIAHRSSRTMQTGVKETRAPRRPWSPPTTYYEIRSMSKQRHTVPEVELVRDPVIEPQSLVDIQAGAQATDREECVAGSEEVTVTESDDGGLGQMGWDRISAAGDSQSATEIDLQGQNTETSTGSREEPDEVEVKEEENNYLDTSNPKQRQIEAGIMSSEKPEDLGTEDAISSKSQDSTSDLAPRGEQDDQDSVEESVTTYDGPNKEQLEEEGTLDAELKDIAKEFSPAFGTKEIPARLTDYLEERPVFSEEAFKSQYSPFEMEHHQTRRPREETKEDVKPRNILHQDVPKSRIVDSLENFPDPDTKRDDGEEQEVPYLSYKPPEPVLNRQEAWEKRLLQETAEDRKMEALRKELEALEGLDDEEDLSLYDEDVPLSLPQRPAPLRTYVMPDPARARLPEELMLLHVPRSPEPPRRITDRAFFRFK